MGPGENAGAVDVGDGLAVAFKVESHNHPRAVEPFQGAATGVGGILRDVFALGARPIAVLDSLRFGELDSARTRYLLERRRGRHRRLRQLDRRPDRRRRDLLRGALRAELPRQRDVRRASPRGRAWSARPPPAPATWSCCSGARTGRDGIGGACVLASAELDEGDEAKRPSVQIGDPFEENKLIECCLELVDARPARGAAGPRRRRPARRAPRDGLEGRGRARPRRRQGAAARGRHGAVRDHDLRVAGADAVRGRAGAARRGARASARGGRSARRAIGEVTDTQRLRVLRRRASSVGDMPVDGAGRRVPALRPRARGAGRPAAAFYSGAARGALDAGADRRATALLALLGSPNVASRRWAFEQYDSHRRLAHGAPARAGRRRRAAARHDGRDRPRDRRLDRRQRPARGLRPLRRRGRGGARVRAEPRLRRAPSRSGSPTASTSATPRSRTSPGSSTRAVEGMAAACRALGVPVVGGNVSLYNEGPEGPIYPTPIVGMVGELPDAGAGRAARRLRRQRAATWSRWSGRSRPRCAGSELAKLRGELGRAGLEPFDLAAVARRARRGARRGRARASSSSAHDVSEGGLACALAECAIAGGVGASVDLEPLLRRAGIDAETRAVRRGAGRIRRLRPARGAAGALAGDGVERASRARHGRAAIRYRASRRGAATIDVSVEDARGVFDTALWRDALREPAARAHRDGRRAPARSPPVGTRAPRARRTARRVRRVRRLRARARRRPARLLRALRAPAPRPGVGRDRHRRERPHHDAARPRPRLAGLRRAQTCRP